MQSSVDAQASSTSSPSDASTADPRSGIKKSSGGAQASSTSSPSDASTADPRSGIKKSSGGAHTSSTPSSSDTTTSAGATPTQTGVPSAVAMAAPAEPPAAALPTQQPTAASPTEQPAAPASSAEPVPSPDAREAATPETPVATAAAPKTDAPHGESHTAPNFAGSDPTNRSGSASSTSANRQSTVVVQTAATPASTAQPRTATQAAVESVTSTFSAVEGALETAVEGALETRAVPKAFSAPVAPPDVVSGVVSKALASVGLSPVVSNNPLAPVDSPALSAVLAWARRENQQTQSSFGRLFAVGVSSEEPALAPLNQQALSQDPNAGYLPGDFHGLSAHRRHQCRRSRPVRERGRHRLHSSRLGPLRRRRRSALRRPQPAHDLERRGRPRRPDDPDAGELFRHDVRLGPVPRPRSRPCAPGWEACDRYQGAGRRPGFRRRGEHRHDPRRGG